MQLHRSDVLAAAIELLDADGLDALSMRRLAVRLGVQSGAVFWHFATKQALLDAIADHLLDGVGDIDTGLPGIARLADLAVRLRRALLSHRDGARVVSGTSVREPNTLHYGDVAVRAAIAAGVAPERAVLVVFSIQHYVLGQTVEEQALAELVASGAERRAIDGERYPAISAAIEHFNATTADERFQYGLNILLAGIASQAPETSRGTVG